MVFVLFAEDVEERRIKKINVAIRPLTPNRGVSVDNVDDIRNVTLNLRLSPTANVSIFFLRFYASRVISGVEQWEETKNLAAAVY
jgi:hypothetical protein